ncbi:CD109 antigen-like [Danio aesculapii]|uniref:CD109 antigen-like n=1 Tax=Danio aesculapii TaxID=1142201 RepID=UPI0024C052FB|nr:CD109 antigen-like [Danio aesculapii]
MSVLGSCRILSLPPVFYDDMTYWYPYQLYVEGFSGTRLVFSNSTSMVFSPRCMSIFIQTDKNYYQPGQTVKFRVVSVTPEGKPYSGRTDIFIRDPKGNMIRQWLAVESFLGVISKELNISQNPPLGSWKITAGVNDVIHERAFTVDHYVLPRFEVKLDVPSVVYYEDTLTGTVTAKYFYGKPVSGFMDVTFVHSFNGIEMRYEHTEMIEGSVEITFDMQDFSTRFNDYSYTYYDGYRPIEFIDVNVNVTESATGLMYNSSARVSIVTNKYQLEFLQYPHIVKPSMTFTAKLKLSLYNQRALSAEDRNISVRLAVMQHKLSPWTWMWSDGGPLGPRMMNSTPSTSFTPISDGRPLGPHMMNSTPSTSFTPIYDLPVQNIELPVTADGLMSFQIQLSDSVATLDLEAQKLALGIWNVTSLGSKEPELVREVESSTFHGFAVQECRFDVPVFMMVSGKVLKTQSSIFSSTGVILRQVNPTFSFTETTSLRLDGPLNFTLESSFNLTKFHYLVTSRAGVVDAGTVQSSSFSLNTDHLWAPQACVVVYHTLPDGEIVNDALHVSFTEVLRNAVSVRWSQDRTEPAESVSLSVSVSEPGSCAGNPGGRQATLNSAEDNGLSEKTVLEEEFLSYSREMTHTDNRGMKMGDPYSVFTACGVTVLTDARLNQEMATNQEMFPMFPGEEGLFMTAMPDSSIQEPRQRKDFPETWIWLDANVSLTSWVAFAIVMSENLGLGISAPAEVILFRDFLPVAGPPAFLIRGELLLLEVNLFNYMDVDLESHDAGRNSHLCQSHVRLLFRLAPQNCLVKPEGLQQSFTQTLFLEFLLQQHTLSRKMTFSFPADVVPDSQRASVSAVGDILGPSIGNLDSLIDMPYGCGEQNMIHFAPNTYVLRYLKSTKQPEEQTRRKAMSYMMEAYERELSYQRVDGSFSAFGDSDDSGSTWYT